MDMVTIYYIILYSLEIICIQSDTDAATAGKWLTGFFENTLNDTYVLENVLILITFDEVKKQKKKRILLYQLLFRRTATLFVTRSGHFCWAQFLKT